MGWAHGIDNNGEDVGYAIPDVCWAEGCEKAIDRGLAHHCGGLESPRFGGDEGCGGFFCGGHALPVPGHVLCEKCSEAADNQGGDE